MMPPSCALIGSRWTPCEPALIVAAFSVRRRAGRNIRASIFISLLALIVIKNEAHRFSTWWRRPATFYLTKQDAIEAIRRAPAFSGGHAPAHVSPLRFPFAARRRTDFQQLGAQVESINFADLVWHPGRCRRCHSAPLRHAPSVRGRSPLRRAPKAPFYGLDLDQVIRPKRRFAAMPSFLAHGTRLPNRWQCRQTRPWRSSASPRPHGDGSGGSGDGRPAQALLLARRCYLKQGTGCKGSAARRCPQRYAVPRHDPAAANIAARHLPSQPGGRQVGHGRQQASLITRPDSRQRVATGQQCHGYGAATTYDGAGVRLAGDDIFRRD